MFRGSAIERSGRSRCSNACHPLHRRRTAKRAPRAGEPDAGLWTKSLASTSVVKAVWPPRYRLGSAQIFGRRTNSRPLPRFVDFGEKS